MKADLLRIVRLVDHERWKERNDREITLFSWSPDFKNLIIMLHFNPKSIKVRKLFPSRIESKIRKIAGKVLDF